MGDLEMIENRRRAWSAAVNARDIGGYLDLLTEDVVWFPPGQPAFRGKEAFEAWLRPFFDRFRYRFAIEDPLVQLAGAWAVERGTFRSEMVSLSDGETMQHGGRYLVIWRKDQDAVWRIERYLDVTEAQEPRDGRS